MPDDFKPLKLQLTLNCLRPEIRDVPQFLLGAVRCRPSSVIIQDGYDEAFSIQGNRVLLYTGGRLAREVQLDTPPFKVGWITSSVAGPERLCILTENMLHLLAADGLRQTIILPSRFTSFWSVSCGLLLTGNNTIEPLLLPSFDAPYKFSTIDLLPIFDPDHLIWSSDEDSLLASYDPGRGTIAIWSLVSSTGAQKGGAGASQRRASLRQPNGSWSPMAFRPKASEDPVITRSNPVPQRAWHMKLLFEELVSFRGNDCHVVRSRNILSFFNPQTQTERVVRLVSSRGPELLGVEEGVLSVTGGVTTLNEKNPQHDGILRYFGDEMNEALLEFSFGQEKVSRCHPWIGQPQNPYLRLLKDECSPVRGSSGPNTHEQLYNGSRGRVTGFNGEEEVRLSLNLAPIAAEDLFNAGAGAEGTRDDKEHWTALPLWFAKRNCATGERDAELEGFDACLRDITREDVSDEAEAIFAKYHERFGERFSWMADDEMSTAAAVSTSERRQEVFKTLPSFVGAEEAKINVLQKELTPFFGDLTTSVAYRTSHAAAPVDRFSMLENMLDWNADLREFKYLERFQSQQAVGAMLEKKFLDLANYSKEAGSSTAPIPSDLLTLDNLASYQPVIDTLLPSSGVHYFTSNSKDLFSRLEPLLGIPSSTGNQPSLHITSQRPSVLASGARVSSDDVAPYNVSALRVATSLSPDMDASIALASPAVNEATAILDATAPAKLKGKIGRESNGYLQKTLELLANRQLALPLGRGALGLQTHRVFPFEQFPQPQISLAAEVAERNHALIHLDLTASPAAFPGEAMSSFTAWPEFHAGVSEIFCLASSGPLTRTWILYSRPAQASYSYGGMLLGLGLTGHLACLSPTDTFRYLSLEHDPSLMGFLLGISAAKRTSMDSATFKLLSLHHRAEYAELGVGVLTHIAAIFGFGLLYQGTCHWLVISNLLREFAEKQGGAIHENSNGRNDGWVEEEDNSSMESEARTLAAGMAIGLILLGHGDSDSRHTSLQLQLTDIIRASPFLRARKEQAFFNAQACNGTKPSVLSSTGQPSIADVENFNITSPAATIALGLMYLRTNNSDVANVFLLGTDMDFVHPTHLTLKVLMRALIMWDSIEPTEAWVRAHLPENLRAPMSQLVQRQGKYRMGAQAHCFCLAGACLALAIRYAGTRDPAPAQTLTSFVHYFLKVKCDVGNGLDEEIIENCVATCALALAVVMAGSGDLPAFKLIRSLLKRVPVPAPSEEESSSANSPVLGYGSYSALSMALGFLFLGHGQRTFKGTIEAAAYLVISLFPYFPSTTSDNRYYLQALRHFYVLATEKHS